MGLLPNDELAKQAGVDPWKLLSQLQHGDPGEIESLSAAFYQAAGDTADAHAASQKAQTHVRSGYSVDDTSPVDYDQEATLADKYVGSVATRQDHLATIAKILAAVGTDLQAATAKSVTEVSNLDAAITKIDGEWETFWQGIGHHLPEEDSQPTRQEYINQEVAAVKSHGSVVNGYVTGYESTLASSLKSMADLGYIPPDNLDEGPGDVNLYDTGSQDGRTTIDAAQSHNSTQLEQSTAKLALIDAAIKANGGHVSDSEYSYLYDYYNTTAKHSDVIDNAVKTNPDLVHTVGARYGDGLLNLTAGAEQTDDSGVGPYVRNDHGVGTYGRGGVDGLPPNVLDVLDSRIGEKGPTPDGGTTNSTGGPEILRAVWKDGHWEIPNYANDTGFGDLLSYADKDVAGGTDFSKQLATTAINWKQDIDAIKQNTAAWGGLDYTGLPGEDNFGQLTYPRPNGCDPGNLPINDAGASGLLSAASHNQTASAEILLDSGDRHAILGLPWQGNGAADLIDSGTAPDPGSHPNVPDPDHPGQSLLNEAALAVVKDAGSHYQDFAKIVSNPVKDALTQLAVTHLASFGDPTGPDAASGVGTIEIPGGHAQGLSLNNADASSYLKLLSLSGPKYSGIVHAAALDLGARWLAADPGAGHDAGGAHAATLIGRVTSSEYAAALDKASDMTGDQQKEYIAQIREQQEEAKNEALQKGILDGIDTVLDIGTMGASEDIKGTVEHFSTVMGAFDTTREDYAGYVSAGQNTPEQDRLIQLGADVQQAMNQPAANAQVHTLVQGDLNYAALKAAGYSNPSIAYTGTADQVSSIVDPALDRYYGTGGGESVYANQAVNTMTPDPSADPQHPTVDWNDADVRRAVNGGDNEVYDSPLAQNSMTIVRELKDVTPR